MFEQRSAVVTGPPPGWAVPGSTPAAGAPGRAAAPLLAAAQDAVDALAAAPVSGAPADVAATLVLAERLRGLALRGLAELERTGSFREAGAASSATWLRREQQLGEDAARGAVRLATRLAQDLPDVQEAVLAGATTVEHARAVAVGTAGLDPDLVRQAGPHLVALARSTDPTTVRRLLRERAEAIDPELGRDAARRRHERRGFWVSLVGGTVALGGTLAEEDGAVLLHGLDLALAADRTALDARTHAQRRADVLVQWARQAAHDLGGPGDTGAQDAHTVRTHLLVECDLAQLQALGAAAAGQQLDALALLTGAERAGTPLLPTGATLPSTALQRLACDATISLVVLGPAGTGPIGTGPGGTGPGGTGLAGTGSGGTGSGGNGLDGRVRTDPLYVGRSSRTVTGLQFKALVARDRHCVVKGCRRRPAQCEAHHVEPWALGGATDLDNLVLLCSQHHHDLHDRGLDLPHHDGRRRLTPDDWAHDPP